MNISLNLMHCFASLLILLLTSLTAARAHDIHVSSLGSDRNPGTAEQPLASLSAAQRAARRLAGQEPVTVLLHAGTHYLSETIRFTAADSGSESAPVIYAAAPGAQPVISGGRQLTLQWKLGKDGIAQARTPAGLTMDQLFVNGQRQHMARYPNYDPHARPFNGAAADAIAPERVARWSCPAGGYIHAMHAALWGDMHWSILGKKPDGTLDYEGGWQNNRPSAMHEQFRFVENIREELDAPGEWFHDANRNTLYFFPPPELDLKTAIVEVVRWRHLIEFNGTADTPVRFVTLRGLTFRHAARTFMDNREPLLRSDWTTYRGGAVLCHGAEDVTIEGCDFDQLGGNAIFVNNYNRRITVRDCLLREAGANGIAFVGDPAAVRSPLFNYGQPFDYATIDRTPGPQSDNHPADCLVDDCLITRSGRFEKQTAPVQISMARNITVRHCSIYDVPRAGINIGDGCWGGHTIEFCDVFDTVLETGDHGSFNSWGRDRYWHPDVRLVDKQVAEDPNLPLLDMVQPTTLRDNRWRCDHGWAIDLDDGSSNYRIYNNLLLHGGLKLREGYQRLVTNNVIVNDSLHPHVWFENSGDVFARNIVMGAYRPALMNVAPWGKEVDRNLFTTSEADRQKFAEQGCDAHSLVANPMFVDAARGDFRVHDDSPARTLGFVNFPMDQFGVRSPRLQALARTPIIPEVDIAAPDASAGAKDVKWHGATLRELLHYEFSALGVAADTGGVLVAAAPSDSVAYAIGLRQGDFIQRVNDLAIKDAKEFVESVARLRREATFTLTVTRNQQSRTLEIPSSDLGPDGSGTSRGGGNRHDASSATSPLASEYLGWKSLCLDNGLVTLQVVPEIGGRVIQFRLGDKEFFWVNPQLAGLAPPESGLDPDGGWLNYGGDKLWPAPQGWDNDQQWPGPPDAVLDGQPYRVKLLDSGAAVRLTSGNDPRSGIRFSRVIRPIPDRSGVRFEATMTNVDTKPRRWGIWAHTQLDAVDSQSSGYNGRMRAYCAINPRSKYPRGYHVIFGEEDNPSFRSDRERGLVCVDYRYQVGKIGVDSSAGWVATVDGTCGAVFVQRFTYEPDREYPDGASVEFWHNGVGSIHAYNKEMVMSADPAENPYVFESEILSPLAQLEPGENYTWQYAWFATNIGGDFPIVDCNHAGVISEPLQASRTSNGCRLMGRFGVFSKAAPRIEWRDTNGNTVGTSPLECEASPLQPLILDYVLPAPENASTAVLFVDGELDEVQLP